ERSRASDAVDRELLAARVECALTAARDVEVLPLRSDHRLCAGSDQAREDLIARVTSPALLGVVPVAEYAIEVLRAVEEPRDRVTSVRVGDHLEREAERVTDHWHHADGCIERGFANAASGLLVDLDANAVLVAHGRVVRANVGEIGEAGYRAIVVDHD